MNKSDVTLCLNCKYCTNKPLPDGSRCPWVDRFEPVPGWTAKETLIEARQMESGYTTDVTSYVVTKCPLYAPDANVVASRLPRNKATNFLGVSTSYTARHWDMARKVLRQFILFCEKNKEILPEGFSLDEDRIFEPTPLKDAMITKVVSHMINLTTDMLSAYEEQPPADQDEQDDYEQLQIDLQKLKLLKKLRNTIGLKRK